MEFIISALLNNPDVIALVICRSQVTSLLFKNNTTPGYVDDKLEQRFKMKFTPQTVMLSYNYEKEQQNLEKRRNNLNVLISKKLLEIKEKYKEVNKCRKEVKNITYQLDKNKENDPFTSLNNSSSFSSSSFSVLDPSQRPQNWTEQEMRDFITDKIIQDRTSLIITNGYEQDIKLMNRDTMNAQLTEFRKLQTLRKQYYNPKSIKKYFIPNIFNVNMENRPTYTIAIPWKAEDVMILSNIQLMIRCYIIHLNIVMI
jgi:hypothetical protein